MSAEEKRPRWAEREVVRDHIPDGQAIVVLTHSDFQHGQRVTVMPAEDAELLVRHARVHNHWVSGTSCHTTCELCALLARLSQPPGKDGSR